VLGYIRVCPTVSWHLFDERFYIDGERYMKGKLGIEFPSLLYVTYVGENCVVDLLESICLGPNYFDHQV
jgi:hypothetical protein